MHDRGVGSGGVVTGDPERLATLRAATAADLAGTRAGAERCSTAVRAYAAAGPNDLGIVVPDRGPSVRAAVRRAERLGEELERFGHLLRMVDAAGVGVVRVSGRVAALLGDAPDLLAASPQRVAAWWAGLSASERSSLVRGAPGLIGGLDGIPFADRHRANRHLVRAHLRVLEIELSAAERRHADNTDGFWDNRWPFNRDIPDTESAVAQLRAQIAARQDWLAREDITIILYDTVGDGRAIVAVGDLATATRVTALVPGITNELSTVHRLVANAEVLRSEMQHVAPRESSATIAWLGYDTPGGPPDLSPASRGKAEVGAGYLRTFMTLLPGEAPRAQVTAIGHSYGSVVVGTAAVQGVGVDRIALIGSPGGGADSVTDYQLPADRVFAATTPDDPIRHVYTASAGVEGIALGGWSGFGPPPVDLEHFGNRSPLGVNPAGPTFGATTFSTDGASGHSGYYDPGTDSLSNLARISVGRPPT